MSSLSEVFNKLIVLLENEKHSYLVIGGMAAAVLGHPRMTEDIDICISIKKKDINDFLRKAEESGFTCNRKEALEKARNRGVFKIYWLEFHVDFLVLSSEFEKKAIERGNTYKLYGIKARFPTPEDLILFKVIPQRAIDVADMENIAKRFSGKLDRDYLLDWAQRLSDEAEDLRIYNTVKRLLGL